MPDFHLVLKQLPTGSLTSFAQVIHNRAFEMIFVRDFVKFFLPRKRLNS